MDKLNMVIMMYHKNNNAKQCDFSQIINLIKTIKLN